MQMLKAKLYLLKQQENAEKASGIRGEVKEIGWGCLLYTSHAVWDFWPDVAIKMTA